MATQSILRAVIWTVSIPHSIVSKVLEQIEGSKFHIDLHQCLAKVDKFKASFPANFLQELVLAEDHRNKVHFGIDPFGMIRALLVRFTRGEIQGASTIEQQFVRVVTGRYERTVSRKIREQLLAISLSRQRGKSEIASAYLAMAYFGTNLVGLQGLHARFGSELSNVSTEQALRFVAQLKYPRPRKPTRHWRLKVARRFTYLDGRRTRTTKRRALTKVIGRLD